MFWEGERKGLVATILITSPLWNTPSEQPLSIAVGCWNTRMKGIVEPDAESLQGNTACTFNCRFPHVAWKQTTVHNNRTGISKNGSGEGAETRNATLLEGRRNWLNHAATAESKTVQPTTVGSAVKHSETCGSRLGAFNDLIS